MHIRRGLLGWGVFLILAGAIPLAVRAGYISNDDLGRYWSLWPLILIGIGVGLVLSRTSFDFVGGLIVAATFGVMVGGLLSVGVSGFGGASCGSTAAAKAFPAHDGTLGVERRRRGAASTAGTSRSGSARAPAGISRAATSTAPVRRSGPTPRRSTSGRSHEGAPSWLGLGDHDTWRLTLPAAPRLGLDVQVNAGRGTLDLAGATLGEVALQLNAGSATLDLGSAAAISTIDLQLNAGSLGVTLPNLSLTGSIQANAGSVKVCVPPGAGLRLHTGESIIASYDYAGHGLVQDGSDMDDAGLRQRARQDRPRDQGQCRLLHPGPGGRLWMTDCIDRATTG